ncbi:toxin VasX [Montanilutibacter psychrotolerans]|uniref:Toxin VasX N-terminal region domain-containing protein n=1 Tax=Montanilutibacter psychrotolerans TaxID=1327343 RepID=A0A3M8SM03_9GAMM|nr:toxin VasX [Lysobacter psychrotolerans]RNF82388.1 hypothetical protein EER27_14660 [Lysobacter psychrotolerans]
MADTGIAAAKRGAAANTTAKKSGAPCPNCVKEGLAILPVISGAFSKTESLPAVFPLEDLTVSTELKALSNGLTTKDLTEHWYFMRALRAGYLYVLKPDKTWDAYLVDSSGLLQAMPSSGMPESPDGIGPMDKPGACSRSEHNNVALQFFVLDPKRTKEVWMAFSRYRWTPKVMKAYADNVDGLRDSRMTRLDVVSAAAGKLGGYEGSPVPHGMKMTASIGNYVADYSSPATRTKINKSQVEPLHDRGASATMPLMTLANGTVLATAMATASKNTEAKVGAIVLLDDIVGVTRQLNGYRNRISADAAAVSGMGDPVRTRKRVIADIIEGIRANAEANPGPWWDKNYGPDRYLRHINQADWQATRQESKQFTSLLEYVKKVSADYCSVKESAQWKRVQRSDFDDTDHRSALDRCDMIASSVAGSGRTKLERDLVWYPALDMEPTDPDNWLARALTGDHRPFLEYLAGNPGDQDEAYDTVKEATQLSDLLTGKAITQVNVFRASIRAQRAANEAMATLVESSAGILFDLRRDNPKAYKKLIRKVALSLLTRDDVVMRPVVVKGTWNRIAGKIMEIATGAPRIGGSAPIRTVPNAGRGPYLATQGNLGGKGWGLSQGLDGAIVLDLPNSRAEAAETVAWVANKLESGGQLDPKVVRRMGLENLDLASRAGANDNPFQRNHMSIIGKKAEVGLSSGALFFQVNAMVGAVTDYFKKDEGLRDAGDLRDMRVGITVSALAGLGAGMDMCLAVQSLRGAQVASRQLMQRWSARLGLAAGVIEGVYGIAKGFGKAQGGDVDSGLWTMGSGVALVLGSAAAYGASTGAVLGIGASLGPVGWALLIIGFLGLALYCAWQAFGTDDENMLPVEYWLDNGIFGKGAHRTGKTAVNSPYYVTKSKTVSLFAVLEEEIYGLQKVTLVGQGRFGKMSDSHGYSLHFSYHIALPRYAKGSRLELEFTAIYKGQRIPAGGIVCEDGKPKPSRSDITKKFTGMRKDPELKVDAKSGVMELEGYFSTMQDETWAENVIEWIVGTESNPDAQYADAMELRGSYWPDVVNLPNLATVFEYPPKK